MSSLPSPNLDDRTFRDLLEEARRRATLACPGWTDFSAGDPGVVLLELFAHLTEVMIYRLNRIPEKAYVEFLRLIGVKLAPPGAAGVTLRFTHTPKADARIEIPRGTRVSVARADAAAEAPVFVTTARAVMESGQPEMDVPALHCELIEAEIAGKGTGLPGLWLTARRPPIIARTADELDLVVGVETARSELEQRAPAVEHAGKAYRVWREVDSFTNLSDPYVYSVDRITGVVAFAPAVQTFDETGKLATAPRALGAIPPAGCEILLWYRRGGGTAGNVAANALTILKDPIPGLQVTNPKPATGGSPAESLQNALIRGPQELHSLQRAVTARDFEMMALRSSGAVARARAFTKSALWVHAQPGTVEVLLVPALPEAEGEASRITIAALREHQSENDRAHIQEALDERKPLGTMCLVNWARYKAAKITARVVARREEDLDALRQRVLKRLYDSVGPLPSAGRPGWNFGQALRAFNVYDIVVAEPGVSFVDQVRLLVDEVPEKNVRCLAADRFQPRTWYAGTQAILYRSLNEGEGWEPAGRFPDESVEIVRVHSESAGILAVSNRLPGDATGSRMYVSRDCGETWTMVAETEFHVEDLAWMSRGGVPVLLMATGVGLYELALRPGSTPVPIQVDAGNRERGFYAVAVSTDVRGGVTVAVAAESSSGIFLSAEGGKTGTFRSIGLTGEDVRVLAIQDDGPVSYLWAGLAAGGADDPGKGCCRWELKGSADAPGGWQRFQKNWDGGSCRAVAFQGTLALAASHHRGVLRIDARTPDAGWQKPEVGSGLPLREAERLFQRLDAVAVDPQGRWLFAGGPSGIHRSKDSGVTFEYSSNKAFLDKITLPDTWLLCSGEHDVNVVGEDEAEIN